MNTDRRSTSAPSRDAVSASGSASAPGSGFPPISEYAFLSDCHTAALLGPDGTVEWMCTPRFDGPSLFGRMLDRSAGGWELSVDDGATPSIRDYLPDSLVLETRWETDRGTVVAHDFLAVQPPGAAGDRGIVARGVLVRLVRCVAGRATVRFRVAGRPDYGRGRIRWSRGGEVLSGEILPGDGPGREQPGDGPAGGAQSVQDGLWLSGEPRPAAEDAVDAVDTRPGGGESADAVSQAELTAGDAAVLALDYRGGPGRRVDRGAAERMLEETQAAWRAWADRAEYRGPATYHVRRSALVLRGLLSEETGGLLAAPTTSLPEWIGGERNWDYRYVWHRDASLIVLVLMRLGHEEEAGRYLHFLMERARGEEDRLEPVISLDGSHDIGERTLDHLQGYAGSRPVRTGNEGQHQHQLCSYGHVLDAAFAYQQVTGGLTAAEIREARRLVDVCARRWREKDHGIWEVRDEPRHWTYSKLWSWVCLDRGIRLAELCGDRDAPLDRWRHERDAVRADLLEHGYDEELGTFVQSYGAANVDASILQLPMTGLLRGDDPRMVSTIDRVIDELGEGGDPGFLVHRYDPKATGDGLGTPEGAFLMCSFDLVSALVLAGRVDEASERFQALCATAGRLGLLSEEMTADGTFLGNFPQAFTHLALIEAAMNLDEADGGDALHAWAERRDN